MYTDIKYNQYLEEMLDQLPKGAFLTVKTKDKLNTIVIGWGHIGFIWGKKVFVAYIRYNRHTFELLEETDEFTVSVPLKNDLKQALAFCGTKSGRDYDKFKACNLTAIKGRKIDTPIIGECELHYECKKIYQQAMEQALISKEVKDRYYKGNNNYHVVYFGEIVDTYLYNKD